MAMHPTTKPSRILSHTHIASNAPTRTPPQTAYPGSNPPSTFSAIDAESTHASEPMTVLYLTRLLSSV